VLIIGFASFLSNHGLRNWLPRILEWHGYTPVDAGYWASLPSLVGIGAALALTRIVTRERRTFALTLLFGISAAATILIALTTGPLLVTGLILQGLVFSSITPLLLLVIMDTPSVGAAAMGTAGGLYFSVGEVGGFAGPSLLGVLLDITGGFAIGLIVIAIVLAIMSAACLFLEANRGETAATP
jgi:cyanate permease